MLHKLIKTLKDIKSDVIKEGRFKDKYDSKTDSIERIYF